MNSNGNQGSYLEWKTITVEETTDDELFSKPEKPERSRRSVFSKSLPSSTTQTDSQTNSQTRTSSRSSLISNSIESASHDAPTQSTIQLEIITPPSIRDTVETQSFVSNTIKRYSRFRAKQERGAARREKRKNGDSARKLRPKKTERQKSERPKSLDYGKNIYANIQNPLDKKTLVATWIETSQNIVSKPEKIDLETLDRALRGKDENSAALTESTLPKTLSENEEDVPLELRCPICLDLYQKPLFLPCGHTYCKGCIQQVVDKGDKETKKKQRFVCPTCRNIIKYGAEGIEALPKNINLEFAARRYEKGQDQKGPYCQTHKKFKQEKVIWCEDCNVMICQMCVTDDHKNHQVAPLAVISEFQRVRKNLRKTKADLADRVETLKKSLQKIEGNRDRITHTAEDLKVKIDKECQAMIALIKKQHSDMTSDMEAKMAKKAAKKQAEMDNLANSIDKTKSALAEITNILNTEEPEKFLQKVKLSKIVGKECSSVKNIIKIPPARPAKLPVLPIAVK